jgi:hypothetical protein
LPSSHLAEDRTWDADEDTGLLAEKGVTRSGTQEKPASGMMDMHAPSHAREKLREKLHKV